MAKKHGYFDCVAMSTAGICVKSMTDKQRENTQRKAESGRKDRDAKAARMYNHDELYDTEIQICAYVN